MSWLFAFTALAVVALVAFAFVGVKAAQTVAHGDEPERVRVEPEQTEAPHGETRFTGGDGPCANCGRGQASHSSPGLWCPETPPPGPLPRFERGKRGHPSELWLEDGRVLLNEDPDLREYGWFEFHHDKWFVPETGEFVPKSLVGEAWLVVCLRQRQEAAKERARKYGGAR